MSTTSEPEFVSGDAVPLHDSSSSFLSIHDLSPPAPKTTTTPHEQADVGGTELSSSQEDAAHGISYHPTFYIREDMIKIRVEDTMFRIPSYLLTRHSDYFKAILGGRDARGDSEPLHLDSDGRVTADAFANLLHVLDPPIYQQITLTTVNEWTSVLNLSSKWGFTAVRTLAIRRLESIASPIDKIALARTYDVNHWLVDAYIAVCERSDALTIEEARRLPLEDVVKISEARQHLRGGLRPTAKARLTVTRVLDIDEEFGPAHDIPPATSDELVVSLQKKASDEGDTSTASSYEPLPSATVMELVTDSLELLVHRQLSSYERGKEEILVSVRRSDKRPKTLRSVLTLIVDKGIEAWDDELLNRGSRCADVCDAIANEIGSDLKDNSLVDTSGQPLAGRAAFTHYITGICQERVTWGIVDGGIKSKSAVHQAGFFADLYSKQLVSSDLIEGWWSYLLEIYENTLSMDISRLRQIHAFLSTVGRLIDVPAVNDSANAVFHQIKSRHRYDDWEAVQPEIQGLVSLRERKWVEL